VNNNLSVRQAEFLVKKTSLTQSIGKRKKSGDQDPNISSLVLDVQNKTGMTVRIIDKKLRGGTISFDYKNLAQLDYLIKAIKEKY
jgi:hypothetical protein